ncbi:MafI family immunity protein [Achromobacter sp. NPDC008082]|uniref:MafI family immunity protein n=1 Tax=Achromobacter sp. NPDC008082 TaxID=3363888 RepID=UPI0036E0C266
MDLNDRIKLLGEKLKNRIDADLVDYALGFIDKNENVLALETLCDQIGDMEISITPEEYSQIVGLVADLRLKMTNRYLYINPNR